MLQLNRRIFVSKFTELSCPILTKVPPLPILFSKSTDVFSNFFLLLWRKGLDRLKKGLLPFGFHSTSSV